MNDGDYQALLKNFPKVTFAFSYGSGVIEQSGYNKNIYEVSSKSSDNPKNVDNSNKLPLLDVIFAVDNPQAWHLENLRMNPSHYTSVITSIPSALSPQIAILQSKLIAYVQEEYGARVWFNTHVPVGIPTSPNRLMKYGVISTKSMKRDLQEWDNLYIAGRLHKPVRIFKNDSADVLSLLQANYVFAASAAILMLSSTIPANKDQEALKFSESDAYLTIASLSYTGDPRMSIAENPMKVRNLVLPVMSQYHQIYHNILENVTRIGGLSHYPDKSGSTFSSTSQPADRLRMVQGLPPTLKRMVLHDSSPDAIRTAISRIVRSSATSQTLKGLFTVGLIKSGYYAWQKVKKRFDMK